MQVINLFHTQLWFPASDHDFQRFESDFRCFCEVVTGKNIVEEIESIVGARDWMNAPKYIWGTLVNDLPHRWSWNEHGRFVNASINCTVGGSSPSTKGNEGRPEPQFVAACCCCIKTDRIYDAVLAMRCRGPAAPSEKVYWLQMMKKQQEV